MRIDGNLTSHAKPAGAAVTRALGRLLETSVLLPLFTLVLLGVIWSAIFHLISVEGAAAKRAAAESSRELLETYEAQMVRNLGAIDQTLRTVKYAYELKGKQLALSELGEKGLLPSAFIFTVSIADHNGDVVASTRPQALKNVAGQQYFRVHLERTTDAPFVGHAILGTKKQEWSLQFSRRLNAPDGSFSGVVTVSVEPEYFTSGYEHSRLGTRGVLGLLGSDGVFLAKRTGDDVSWGEAANYPLGVSAGNPQAADTVLSVNPWDGVRRYTNARRIYGFPLTVIVGLSEDEQLEGFRRHQRTYLWEATAASVLLAAIMAMLGRLSWKLTKNQLRTRKDQETYYAASNASLDAFFVLRSVRDAQGGITDFILDDTNSQGARLFGAAKGALLGKTLCQTFPQVRMNGVFDEFVKVARTGSVHEQEWENRLPLIRAAWLHRQVVRVEDGVVVIMRDITERKRAEVLRAEQTRVFEMIATSTPLEEVLKSLMRLIESQLPGMMGSVMLLDEDEQCLRHGAAVSLPAAYTEALDGIPVGPRVGSCGTAIHRREPVIVADIQQDPLWDDYRALAAEHHLRACWSAPVLSHQDRVLGSFSLYSREVHEPGLAEMQLVEMATRIAGIAIERKQTEDRIRHMAHHDALTGLPNRTLFEDRVQQGMLYAERYDRQMTVVFVDLDNFKMINDTLGHNAGDELLKTVAQRMEQCVRTSDTVMRLGGDEFVLVLCHQADMSESIVPTLQRIHDAIAQPIHIGGQKLQVTCSMGSATYPGDGDDTATLLMNADAAMYRAKELGRNNYQLYTAEMNSKIHERFALQEGLRNALARHELFLAYQPQIDLRSGRIFGVEALLRWQHPELGLITPTEFVPMAEESGLIVPIGDWVFRTACNQNKAWQDAGLPPTLMSVNVSARQFKEGNLVKRVAYALQESGMEAQYLELELTESLIMQDLQKAVATMRELGAMGVKLSIDDFGTGYSSLSALKSFPIVRLKLDQLFVRDLPQREDDKAIAMAVISLGHKLNLKVLAEGVETEQQLAFLRDNDCDEMQGYHFSKPVSPQEIEHLFWLQLQEQEQPSFTSA
jgi:diguanylate cyclase (GGDEF)-like protein